MKAFVKMRKFISDNSGLLQRMDGFERKLLETDHKFEQVFKALENKNQIPSQGVFFDGQVFDAYELASKIIRSATKEIILIDNYIIMAARCAASWLPAKLFSNKKPRIGSGTTFNFRVQKNICCFMRYFLV